jgi:glycerol-1-phosphate dehydrogenase [NAD(P)+]
MWTQRQVTIPALVRVKPGALDRVGIYARRLGIHRVAIFSSEGLPRLVGTRLTAALANERIEVASHQSVGDASWEAAQQFFAKLPQSVDAVLGVGGGKALDVAKYVAFLGGLRYFAVPTSLSNDGFASPQSSLTQDGKRRSLPAEMPYAVVLDTQVCLEAPETLWLSGVGDLVCKLTAVTDWKLAFHAVGTPVDDFAALLSDATVFQFLARPIRDRDGITLLGTALLLNGIAMGICGSSRPASGSEHLISHALDAISERPRLHGLQVGMAAYVVSQLQGRWTEEIALLFDRVKFWRAIGTDPFRLSEWRAAVHLAPSLKAAFYTVLSARDCGPEVEKILRTDVRLRDCFV